MIRRVLASLAVLVAAGGVVVGVVSLAGPKPAAAALSGSQFQAGNIISDAVFYNSSTMSEAGIQSFLNTQVPTCDAGYTCLRDYRTPTQSHAAESGLCSAYTGRASETAAQIFARVGVACGINPQALVVLVQKEQGLVLSTAPSQRQYDFAAGQGCPDFSVCNPKYQGFFNQIYYAARQFRLYRLNPTDYGYVAGRNNFILYNPNTKCGGSQVYIQNQATAGLYNYTPYQPNAAALNNLNGTGDSCSAYGNRNFWVFYNTWFTNPAPPSQPYDAGGLVGTKADGTLWYYSNSGSAAAPYLNPTKIGLGGWQKFDRIVAGDIDADGRADLVATQPNGSLWLYRNNGTSLPYQGAREIGTSGWNVYDRIMLADVDNDGRADIVATKPDGSLWVYRNTGDPTRPFGPALKIGNSGWNAFDKITLGDTNGDGRADIVATKPDGSLWLYLNSGSASRPFGSALKISSIGWQGFNRIMLGDVNNDGLADMVATKADGTLWEYQNVADPTHPFTTSRTIGLGGWQGFSQLALTQVPVPRRADAANIAAVKADGTLWSAANDVPPTPYFGRVRIGDSGWGGYDLLVSGDVNGDGRPDLIARKPNGSLWLYLGTGDASNPFSSATEIGLGGWQQFDRIVALDVNGDGRSDLVVTKPDGSMLLYPNSGNVSTPFLSRTQLGASGWNVYDRIVAGDVTGDGRADLVATRPDGSMWEFAGSGSQTSPFAAGVRIAASGWAAYAHLMLIGPTVPQDGQPADLVATAPDGTLWLFRNSGAAGQPFDRADKIGLGGWGAFPMLVAADVDGDGQADLVVTMADGSLWLYRNRGTGPFAPTALIGASGWRAFDKITSGDVDGDGLPDLVASKPDGTLWYYHNGGDPSHPYSSGVKIGLGGWQAFNTMIAGDVTGDGLADLVLTKPDGTLWLYVNRGSATAPYSGAIQIGAGWQSFRKLAVGDVTGDGLDDIVGIGTDGTLWLYPNTHNPSNPFTSRIQIGLDGWNATTQLALADVDHDGRADLVSTETDGRMFYYRNSGVPGSPFDGRVQLRQTGWQAFTWLGM